MRLCLMTVVSDPFVYGALVMLKSFKATNPWFKGDIVVLWNPENAPLSDSSREILDGELSGITYVEVDNDRYGEVFHFAETVVQTPQRLRAAFYILEAFHAKQYDRILTLDSDMLILGDLSRLFEIDEPFGVVRAFDHVKALPLPYFNTGTMVVRHDTPEALGFEDLRAAIRIDKIDKSHGKADQAVLNVALRGSRKHFYDHRYNFSKRLCPYDRNRIEPFLKDKDVRVLHFLGEKPWNVKAKASEAEYQHLEMLWVRHLTKYCSRGTMFRYFRSVIRQVETMRAALVPNNIPPNKRRQAESAIMMKLQSEMYSKGEGVELQAAG